jgi:hypothetical protein
MNSYQKRAEYERLGLCKQCGKMPAQKNRKFCFQCLLAKSRYHATRTTLGLRRRSQSLFPKSAKAIRDGIDEALDFMVETKTQQWTPGAMKAAIWIKLFPNKTSPELARIISAETHDAEMAELLREAIQDCGCTLKQRDSGHLAKCFAPRAIALLSQIGGQE